MSCDANKREREQKRERKKKDGRKSTLRVPSRARGCLGAERPVLVTYLWEFVLRLE